MCLSILCPIPKSSTKIRPISVLPTLRRVFTRTLVSTFKDQVRSYLEPLQLGMAPQGCERVVHAASFVCASRNMGLLLCDSNNAFGDILIEVVIKELIARFPDLAFFIIPFLLQEQVAIFDGEEFRASGRGVPQGCPLSPVLFSIGFHIAVQQAAMDAKVWGGEVYAYLDDLTICCPPSKVDGLIDRLEGWMLPLGLRLNRSKCCFVPPEALSASCEGANVFRGTRSRASNSITSVDVKEGALLLGIPVGSPFFVRSEVSALCARLDTDFSTLHAELMGGGSLLWQPALAFNIARSCILSEAGYTLRGLSPTYTSRLASHIGDQLSLFIKRLILWPMDKPLPETTLDRIQLPITWGGLGLRVPNSKLAYTASIAGLREFIQEHYEVQGGMSYTYFLHPLAFYGSPDDFKAGLSQHAYQAQADQAIKTSILSRLSVLEHNVLLSSGGPHAGSWLLCFSQGSSLRASDFVAALRARLVLPQIGFEGLPECQCGVAFDDRLPAHHLVCVRSRRLYFRHNLIRDVLVDMAHEAGLPHKKEPMFVLEPPRPGQPGEDQTNHRPDFILRDLEGHATRFYDVKITSPVTEAQLAIRNPKPGQAAKRMAQATRATYRQRHEGEVIPLVAEAYGRFGMELLEFCRYVAEMAAKNPSKRLDSQLFVQKWTKRISVNLQRGHAAMAHDLRQRCRLRMTEHIMRHHIHVPQHMGAPPGLTRCTTNINRGGPALLPPLAVGG